MAVALYVPLVASLLCCGCGGTGDGRAAIQGEVLFNGEPVQTGMITFISDGGPSAGSEIVNGRYSVAREKGPALGTNRVEVSWPKKTGKQIPVGSPAPAGTMTDETKEAIPAQYNKSSTLTVEIEAGENSYDLDLKS